jgi:tripartite ATP-independent transporter DctM subunit
VEWITDHLAVIMFLVLTFIMFIGYPVAYVLGGVALGFGVLGILLGTFHVAQFGALIPRIWGQAVENQVLLAVPMFVFMGTMLERSGVAEDLLRALQVLTRRIPGGLAMSVVIMGTIMAATTGIVGASVIMLTLIALPTMLAQGYAKERSVGCIASAGTLGILIPPSIMLIVYSATAGVSVVKAYAAALFPGLLLAGMYMLYIMARALLNPKIAPKPPKSQTGRRSSWATAGRWRSGSCSRCSPRARRSTTRRPAIPWAAGGTRCSFRW